jgi:hypothetical protein
MKRVLSLLLLIPFLTVQSWAWRGGPYDSMVSRSAYAGTYGVAFTGSAKDREEVPDPFLKKIGNEPVDKNDPTKGTLESSAIGVMTMSVPSAGLASGRVLLFNAGMMYLGNAQGTLNAGSVTQPGKAKMTMLQQLSHYTARTASNGIQKQGDVVVDLILSGALNLELATNFQTGLIEVTGTGKLYKFAPMMTAVKVDTTTATTQESQGTDQTVTSTSSSTSTQTVVDDVGATVTTNSGQQTTGPSSTNNTNVNTTGAVQTLTFEPEKVRQAPVHDSEYFMSLTALGVREDTNAAVPSPFTAPSEQTFFQIDIPAPAGNGAGNGTGTTTATQ